MARKTVGEQDLRLWMTLDVYKKLRGVTDNDLADRIGISSVTISNYRTGKTDIPLGKLRLLVRTLNVPTAEIVQYII